MSMTLLESIITICAVVFGTILTRFIPFMIFPDNKTPPKYIKFLGKVLPYAVIGLLLVYCQKDISLIEAPHGIPEIIAILSIVIIHHWKRNMLLSIITGTVTYMFLVQYIFI